MQQSEAKYVNDFLATKFPTALQWKRVRLGPLPNVEQARLYQITLRWADAVIYDGKDVSIVEAKIANQVGGLAQLELYAKLFRETPEFSAYKGADVKLILVAPKFERDVDNLARSKNIQYVVFKPAWLSIA